MSEKIGVVEDMGGGIKRQILAYNDDAMAVKVWFEKGAEGYAHSHRHTQIVYCEEGEFNFVIDGKLKVLKAGDSCVINPHIEHGTTTETGGILIDMFSPMREDFL